MGKVSSEKAFVIYSVVLIALLFFSCTKDDLTQPVKVRFSINSKQIDGLSSYLSINKTVVGIGEVSFIGLRQQGSDVHFDTKQGTHQGTFVISADQQAKYITYFDIPQGIYDYMNWDITLYEIDDDIYEDTLADIEDYGLLIHGLYTKIDGSKIPIYFVVPPLQKLSFETTNLDGSTPISITDGNIYNINIELNPAQALSSINRDFFEQAIVEDDEEMEYIIVSGEINPSFYQFFLFNLEKTLKATVL